MARTEQPTHWHRLDNTANLFPVISGRSYANVYRISLVLEQPVDAELLQRAVDTALPWFAAFRVRMRSGAFWHYLEYNDALPRVEEEDDAPCRYIDPRQNNGFLFRITYFGRRVNLEVFHALTDGTGAVRFLGAIVCQYLMLAHPGDFDPAQKARRWFAQHGANTQDGYVQNYVPTKKNSFKMGTAYRIRGEKLPLDELGVVHACIDLPGLKTLCRALGVTITQYLAAVIAHSIYETRLAARAAPHPLNIFVPVNLRPVFGSETSLNFFSNIYISLPYAGNGIAFDEVLASVKHQFETKINREGMLENISYTVGSGYSKPIRVVPLPLKHIALRAIYKASSKSSTMSFTNIGPLALPEPFARHVSAASVLLSPSPRNPFQCAACSYGDIFTLSFTTTLRDVDIQRAVLRRLAGDGLAVSVETNGVDYESM